MSMIITLDQVGEEVKENINECTERIKKFITLMNTQLEEDEKVESNFTLPVIYLNSRGNRIKVYWVFSFGTKRDPDITLLRNKMETECICFLLEEELNEDFEVQYRNFSLDLYGVPANSRDKFIECIDFNNSNYELTSILTKENAATCILKIKDVKKRVRLMDSLSKIIF